MPRYFLRVRDGDTLLPDDGEADVFKTLAAVRREVIASARRLLSEAALSGTAASLNQQIEVMDGAGKTVMTMSVGHAVGTESQS